MVTVAVAGESGVGFPGVMVEGFIPTVTTEVPPFPGTGSTPGPPAPPAVKFRMLGAPAALLMTL